MGGLERKLDYRRMAARRFTVQASGTFGVDWGHAFDRLGRPSLDTNVYSMVCKCPIQGKGPVHLLKQGDTHYPQMGYMCIGGIMVDPGIIDGRSKERGLEPRRRVLTLSLIKNWASDTYTVATTHVGMDRASGLTFLCTDSCAATPFRKGVLLSVLIRRVQRCARRRRADKFLAVMMCSHERLGGVSMLSMLPPEILREKILAA
jgi:hypothetical protein